MENERIITIHFDTNNLTAPMKEYQRAVGRLSTWAIGIYDKVDIYSDGENDMVAHYSVSSEEEADIPYEKRRKYVIGAIFSPSSEEYSFHS